MYLQLQNIIYGFAFVLIFISSALAEEHSASDEVFLLTIFSEKDEILRKYSCEQLEALSATKFKTSTIWTDGIHSFTGVSLLDLAKELGVENGSFIAKAINDYSVRIPVSDATRNGPIIAYKKDGEKMSVRNKGPLWIIYPYDNNAKYQSEVIYSRSIWQLDSLKVTQ